GPRGRVGGGGPGVPRFRAGRTGLAASDAARRAAPRRRVSRFTPLATLRRTRCFRVPAIAMGPFAPRKIEQAGPYEHCSILRMIEWRWGLAPMTLRDRYARNFAEALDFTSRRAPIVLPRFAAPPPTGCIARWTKQEMPVSRPGWVRRVVEVPT